jgi:Rad3-related DNA helicase
MDLPVAYEKSFPFDQIRPQQAKAIEFAIDAWLNKGKKYVVLEMGTGCGKSAIGVTLSRWLRSQQFVDNTYDKGYEPGTWFLTTQKVLQEQYMSDFGIGENSMRTIKSSSNYRCQLFDYSKHPMNCAEVSRLMGAHKFFKNMYKMCACKCRYRDEKKDFIEAADSLTNYPYFFAESNHAKGITPRELLILDEAHTIEEQLGKYVEVIVSEKFAKDKLKKRMPKIKDMQHAVEWIRKNYKPALKKELDRTKKLLNDPNAGENGKVTSLTNFAKQFELLDKHMCKINRFLEQYSEENWVMNLVPAQGKSMRKLAFKPVDVSEFSQAHLFRMGNKVLFLSATILDKDVFCKTVGLDPNDVAFHRTPSPFPIENRPIHFLNVGNMNRANIDKTLPKQVEVIKMLLEEHKGEKGIIHCVNYRVAKHIYEHVADDRLLIHDSTNRDETVEYHCETSKPTVLVSPSMMEGVDLRNERSRFQIVCKIPFPFLGDQVVQKRMKKDEKWYDHQTVRQVVQALGRSIRNDKDHAVTYILDSDWKRFFYRTKDMFPEEITKAIIE